MMFVYFFSFMWPLALAIFFVNTVFVLSLVDRNSKNIFVFCCVSALGTVVGAVPAIITFHPFFPLWPIFSIFWPFITLFLSIGATSVLKKVREEREHEVENIEENEEAEEDQGYTLYELLFRRKDRK